MVSDWRSYGLLVVVVGCGHSRPPAPTATPARGEDVLCPERIQLHDWTPPADWRLAGKDARGESAYETPHGTQSVCNFTRQVRGAQEAAARDGADIPFKIGIAQREAPLEAHRQAVLRERTAQDERDRMARAAELESRARAETAEADARTYAAANLRRLAGVKLCELNAQEESWRREIRDERRAAAVSGYEDKAALHEAGVEIVAVQDARAELVRQTRAATKGTPACDAFAAGVYACAEQEGVSCSTEQYLARNAVKYALEILGGGSADR